MKQYKETIESLEYKIFSEELKQKGVEQDIVVYALWFAGKNGKIEEALKDMEVLIKGATEELSEFKSEVRHIMGNADRPFPQKLESTKQERLR